MVAPSTGMKPEWEPVMRMERFVDQVASCGLSDDSLAFARLACSIARSEPPRNAEESLALWERIVAHGELSHYPLDGASAMLASLAWREGHVSLVQSLTQTSQPVRRKWWNKSQRGYTVSTRPW